MADPIILTSDLIIPLLSGVLMPRGSCTDFNTYMETGLYKCYNPENGPGEIWGILKQITIGSNIGSQTIYSSTGNIYYRTNWDGWGAWRRVTSQVVI